MSASLPPLQPIKTERERMLEKAIEDARGCLDAGYVKQAKACLTNALDWQYGEPDEPAQDLIP